MRILTRPASRKKILTTIAAHLILSAICIVVTRLTDYVERAAWWPLVGCFVFLSFGYLQRQTQNTAAEISYFSRRLARMRWLSDKLVLILALVASALLMTTLLWVGSQVSGSRVHQFMYAPMSYSFGMAVPVLIVIMHVLRIFSLRVSPTTGIVNRPVLNSFGYLLTLALLLPSLGAYYLTHLNSKFVLSDLLDRLQESAFSTTMQTIRATHELTDSVGPALLSRAARVATIDAVTKPADLVLAPAWLRDDVGGELAITIARRWRMLLFSLIATVGTFFYCLFSVLSSYKRRTETVLASIVAPIILLWLSAAIAATVLTHDNWTLDEVASLTLLGNAVRDSVNNPSLDAVLIGWMTVIPFSLVLSPLLVVTLNDPYKKRDITRAQQRDNHHRHALRRLGHAGRWWVLREVALFWTRVVRAQLVAIAIWRKNVTALVFSLPLSIIATARAVGRSPDVLFITATVSGSLVWLGVLVNGLYWFIDTCSAGFESGLVGNIRGIERHAIIVGYNDVGRGLLREWVARGLLGYSKIYDHLEAGSNVILPNGELARLFLKVLVIDEPHPSGIGLVSLQRNVSASVVTATPHIREYIKHESDNPDVRNPFSALRHDFHQIQSRLTQFYVPMVAGDLSAAEVRGAASVHQALFVVATGLNRSSVGGNFVSLEALRELAQSGTSVPAAALTTSSAFAPHLLARATLPEICSPVHVIQIDRLEASEAAIRLWACIEMLWHEKKDASVLVVASGRRLFHLFDQLLVYLSLQERRSFGTAERPARNRIVILSEDPVLDDLPRRVARDEWNLGDGRLAEEQLVCNVVCYRPHVARLHPQGKGLGNIDDVVAEGMWVLHVKGDSRDHQTTCVVDEVIQPNVVVISEPLIGDAVRRLSSISTAITRRKDTAQTQLIVTADRSRPEMSRPYEHALAYNSAVSHQPRTGLHPRGSEGYVDPLREAVERVSGVLAAHSRVEGRVGSEVVEVHICSLNGPGGIASTLVKLCGAQQHERDQFNNRIAPTLSDMRLDIKNGGQFTLRAYCRLSKQSPHSSKNWPGCRLSIGAPSGRQRSSASLHVLSTLGIQPHSSERLLPDTESARASCCGMATCPIEGTHKLLVAAEHNPEPNDLDRLARHYWAAGPKDQVWHQMDRRNATLHQATAVIELTCEGAEERGSFATAVGALLGWTITPREGHNAGNVVHVTHMTGIRCHDPRFGLYSLYGFTRRNEDRPIPSICDVVRKVSIRPVTERDDWLKYKQALSSFFASLSDSRPSVSLQDEPPRTIRRAD